MQRCEWAINGSEADQAYHDQEWGVPVHDDRLLFEFLILEGAQAGLSWTTILRKRHGYRKAFDNFNGDKIVLYTEEKIKTLLGNPEIVRNRLKIRAAVNNAKAFLETKKEYGSFDTYIWQFVGGHPIQNAWQHMTDLPSSTPESVAMSKALKKRGLTFVGPTICYAFMQAVGMVNDHTIDCFRYRQIKQEPGRDL
jgi:DNA-3-methyladenine glycosylase I